MTKPNFRPHLTFQPCSCGHPSCHLQQPVGMGSFYQGTGFSPEEAAELSRRWDAASGDTPFGHEYGEDVLLDKLVPHPPLWRHVKRGSLYEILGVAVLQDDYLLEGHSAEVWTDELTGLRLARRTRYGVPIPSSHVVASVQATHPGPRRGDLLVLYRAVDGTGSAWLRPVAEFYDGRFKRVS